MTWQPGQPIVRREVWRGIPKVACAASVVADTGALLAIHVPEGSPMAFAADFFGAPHAWSTRDRWNGHGVLQLQRPGEMHAVWVFWRGPQREFAGWYVNLQEPFRRTAFGVDTHDLELDIVIAPDGSWEFKDDERLEHWIERGRWTASEVAAIRAEGARIATELEAGRRWWSDEWAEWMPDPAESVPELPADWNRVL